MSAAGKCSAHLPACAILSGRAAPWGQRPAGVGRWPLAGGAWELALARDEANNPAIALARQGAGGCPPSPPRKPPESTKRVNGR